MTVVQHSFDAYSVRRTIAKISEILEHRLTTQSSICRELKIEKSRFSRWLSGRSSWQSIGRISYFEIIDFIEKRKLFDIPYGLGSAPALDADDSFVAIAAMLGLSFEDIDFARDKLIGYYVCYRYSFLAPPDILRSALEIQLNGSRALKTIEQYRFPGGTLGPGSNQLNFNREGFIWPTKMNMFVMISKWSQQEGIQVAYLNREINAPIDKRVDAVHTVEGFVIDYQAANFHFTKLILQKVEKPLSASDIGLIKPEEMSAPILSKLKDEFEGPHKFLRVYK